MQQFRAEFNLYRYDIITSYVLKSGLAETAFYAACIPSKIARLFGNASQSTRFSATFGIDENTSTRGERPNEKGGSSSRG